jgi:hypothetical protein
MEGIWLISGRFEGRATVVTESPERTQFQDCPELGSFQAWPSSTSEAPSRGGAESDTRPKLPK